MSRGHGILLVAASGLVRKPSVQRTLLACWICGIGVNAIRATPKRMGHPGSCVFGLNIHVHHRVEGGFSVIDERGLHVAFDASIVEANIETAARLHSMLGQCLDLGRDHDICSVKLAIPPASRIIETVSSPRSVLRLPITTCAPSRANASAVARPIPDPPPVTSATLPSNSFISRIF